MNRKILITRKIPLIAKKMLQARGYLVDENKKDKNLSQAELISLIKKKPYDAILTLLTDKINKKVFEAGKKVKIYSNYATGFDNIDIKEAKKRGVVVTNAPAEKTSEAVAEFTISLIFALAKRVVESDKFLKDGKYTGWVPLHFLGIDLKGKTLGLVGTGRIGERVAELASAIGIKIIYTNLSRNTHLEELHNAIYFKSLEKLLQKADIVSLHVPLLPSTHHLINKKNIELMKRDALLINTSRGPVIEEKALISALTGGKIGGVALDVYEFEPKIPTVLKKLPNTILTPHIASASYTAREQMAKIAAQNIIDCLEGNTPRNIVNK